MIFRRKAFCVFGLLVLLLFCYYFSNEPFRETSSKGAWPPRGSQGLAHAQDSPYVVFHETQHSFKKHSGKSKSKSAPFSRSERDRKDYFTKTMINSRRSNHDSPESNRHTKSMENENTDSLYREYDYTQELSSTYVGMAESAMAEAHNSTLLKSTGASAANKQLPQSAAAEIHRETGLRSQNVAQHSSESNSTEPVGELHLPGAIIIGAKKAGTRALLEFLRLHPLVKTAKQELHYFDRHYHQGALWYKKKLPRRLPGEVTVEKTPAYLVSPQVPGRVRQLLPKVKLLMVVREPATRALSDYTQGLTKHSLRKNFTQMVFADQSTGLVNVNWGPVVTGLYARHLQRWLHYFPLSSIHVVDGENLVRNPAAEMNLVEKFLGLPQFISPRHFTFNKTKGFPCIVMDLPPNMSTGTGFHGPRQDPMDVNPNNPTRIGSPGLLDSSRPGPPPKPDTSPPKIHCLGSTKGRDHPEVNSETFGILKEFFRPFNHKFFRMIGRRIDKMEAALLPDERTDLVSMNRLGHGWAYQKLANQRAFFRAGSKDGCDWLPA